LNVPRIGALLVSATAALALASQASADAMPAKDPAIGLSAKAPMQCPTQVVGVQGDGRMIFRTLTNAQIVSEKTTPAPLTFDPTGFALYDFKTVKGGYRLGIRAIQRLGYPSIISVTQHDSSDSLHVVGYKTMKNTDFHGFGAFAGSGSYYVFTAWHGKLKRWTTSKDPRGVLAYTSATVVTKNVPGLRTLSFMTRKRVDGALSDILWGTTNTGKLQQIRVPVDDPRHPKVITVRKHGFDAVNAISLSYCGNHQSTLSLIAISGAADTARWLTMREQFQPRSRNLTDHGLAGEGANWHLHATF
jgi:hypothetical protein